MRWLVQFGLGLSLVLPLVACQETRLPVVGPGTLNSRYTDEQPAFSGDGRFLAFVSNRFGKRSVLLYDLQQRQLVDLPHLNRRDAIAESPSLSYTGRYVVYVASDRGRPEVELYDRVTRRTQILTLGYRGWIQNPSISPDGRYITFMTGRKGQWDIEVLDRGPGIEPDLPNFRRPAASPQPTP